MGCLLRDSCVFWETRLLDDVRDGLYAHTLPPESVRFAKNGLKRPFAPCHVQKTMLYSPRFLTG